MDLSSLDPKVLITTIMTLFAVVVTMTANRKMLSIDKFESFLGMRLARLGMLLISPVLYPYFVGRRMRYRLFRANQKSKTRFAKKQISRMSGNGYPHNERLAEAEKKLAAPRKNYYKHIWNGSPTHDGDVGNRILTWLLGAIPIIAVALLTWIPELRSIDIGVTEAFATAMNTAGEWLVSAGGK